MKRFHYDHAPLLRQVTPVQVIEGRRTFLYFGGCDYFRLSWNAQLKKSLSDTIRAGQISVGASRTTTGNHPAFKQCEGILARFFGAPSAVLVSAGYLANIAVAQAMAGSVQQLFLDDGAHPSLQDAARFFDCEVIRFQSRNPDDLAVKIASSRPGRSLVCTDGVFAADGSVAPLAEYSRLIGKGGWLLVDDSHGLGVLGRKGRGAVEHCGLKHGRLIVTGTLSKAFGLHGGLALAPDPVVRAIRSKSAAFVASTPVPPAIAAAAGTAVRLLRTRAMRERLTRNAARIKESAASIGVWRANSPAPIVALYGKSRQSALSFASALRDAGIYPPLIRYPGGPRSGYFRFAISSEHTGEHIERLCRVIESDGRLLLPAP